MGSENLGAKMGPRLAALMGRAVVSTTQQLGPHKVRTGMQLQENFFRLVGSEVGQTVSHLTRRLADDPDAPLWAQHTFKFMADATGQWAALLNFAVYGSGIGQGLGALLTNEMAPLVQKALKNDPNALVPVDALASFTARGIIDRQTGESEAAKQAVDATRFHQLTTGQKQIPPPDALMDMWRRGNIDASRFRAGMARNAVDASWVGNYEALRRAFLAPSDMAEMVDRGEIDHQLARDTASKYGLTAGDFDKLVAIVGVPPATELLMMAFRRGIIDRQRLGRGIRQSPLRTEWTDVIEKLQFDPLSTPDAADAVLQGHMSMAEGIHYAFQNGMHEKDFRVLVDSAGRPPGTAEMMELWNRGLTNEQEVKQALLESPLKNKWVPLIMKTRVKIPPQEQVRLLVKNGVLTAREGITKLVDLGYSHSDASAFIELATTDKTQTERDLTKSEILNLYEFRLIDGTATERMLKQLGYSVEEANFMMALYDHRRAKRETDAVVSVIRSKFVAHKISEQDAATSMDAAHVTADARDHLIPLWRLEREANVATLTSAQILTMGKKGLISGQDAYDRLIQHGYSDVDATLLLQLHGIQ